VHNRHRLVRPSPEPVRTLHRAVFGKTTRVHSPVWDGACRYFRVGRSATYQCMPATGLPAIDRQTMKRTSRASDDFDSDTVTLLKNPLIYFFVKLRAHKRCKLKKSRGKIPMGPQSPLFAALHVRMSRASWVFIQIKTYLSGLLGISTYGTTAAHHARHCPCNRDYHRTRYRFCTLARGRISNMCGTDELLK